MGMPLHKSHHTNKSHHIPVHLPQPPQYAVGHRYERPVLFPPLLLPHLVESLQIPKHRRRRRHPSKRPTSKGSGASSTGPSMNTSIPARKTGSSLGNHSPGSSTSALVRTFTNELRVQRQRAVQASTAGSCRPLSRACRFHDYPTRARAIDAVHEHGLSFWDAMIWATARQAGCSTVLSEDMQDGQRLGGVEFVDPCRSILRGWSRSGGGSAGWVTCAGSGTIGFPTNNSPAKRTGVARTSAFVHPDKRRSRSRCGSCPGPRRRTTACA